MAASDVSAIPEVRNYLLNMQRDTAKENSVIMDGRDIGTVILPDAEVKIFLKTSPEERARRRFAEQQIKGETCTYEEVLRDIRRRDEQDSNRAVAPLKAAEDAVVLDNSGYEPEDTFREALAIVERKIAAE